ncbi:hypothetical protein [Acinetobacter sp. ANC 3813]|uniref:hypothetical protein n=1 Tax=Acinetobacter sp. ANC 3813 TaxID=1977873 RepID=UPI000A34866A|nr:hypothetical protein [Acinetobacter sp. ANC 3813]OTG87857.1 hypothetical protein B9T34_16100 [Acinetobacter sp. ANC 3813]
MSKIAKLLPENIFSKLLKPAKDNGRFILKPPTAAQLASGLIQINNSRYDTRTINKLFRNTDFNLIDPDSAPMEQISKMCVLAHQRKFIPVFFASECSENSFNSLSFGVFESSNPSGIELNLFAFASKQRDIMDIEDNMEARDSYNNNVVDKLNDLFAIHGGVNYSIIYTIQINEEKEPIELPENK